MKTTLRILVFLCVFSGIFAATGSFAQVCPNNLITNGDFALEGANWQAVNYSTPQYGLTDGCTDLGYCQLWGNLRVGEAVAQNLGTGAIQAGQTYSISVCYRWGFPAVQDTVRFRLSASSTTPNSYPSYNPQNYDLIGLTPDTYSEEWTTFTFPDWTAPNNASWIVVNPENNLDNNDGNYISWGRIDDICIELVVQPLHELEAYTEPLTDGPGTTEVGFWDFQDSPGAPSWQGWTHGVANEVGDYSQVYYYPDNMDACCSNLTSQVVFFDDGIVQPETQTTGIDWTYGPFSSILNNSGGLTSDPTKHLHNEIWSPAIALPGVIGELGAELSFDVYRHEPLDFNTAGMLYYWRVRSAPSALELPEAEWQDWNVQYYGEPGCLTHKQDISDLLECGATHVQIALGVIESGWQWCYDGADGTPAPYFDNVRLGTYNLAAAPILRAREIDLLQDSFPTIGTFDYEDLSNNSIRLDGAQNISDSATMWNTPGDSIVCFNTVCGQAFPVMLAYSLNPNPLFNAYRTQLPDTGILTGAQIGTSNGYSFDFPDEGFFFPGDVLHYYFYTGNASFPDVSLPDASQISNFGDFSPLTSYPSTYTVRGLPTIVGDGFGGFDQPSILFWNDRGNQEDINGWFSALHSLDYEMGVDYDVYSTNCPTAGVGNGLGGRATAVQLEDYKTILYSSGEWAAYTISEENYCRDAGKDIGVLDSWMRTSTFPNPKNLFLTGGNLIYDLAKNNGTTGTNFIADFLGVTLIQQDVRPLTGNQTTLNVKAMTGNPVFEDFTEWAICGIDACTCPGYAINAIAIENPPQVQFLDSSGNSGVYTSAAATFFQNSIYGSEAVVLPYDLMQVHYSYTRGPLTAQASVLQEVLNKWGHTPGGTSGGSGGASIGNCSATQLGGAPLFSVCNYPNGTGMSWVNSHISGGSLYDASITLTVRNASNEPIAGYPRSDMWIEVIPGPGDNTFTKCGVCGWLADSDTDINGVTTFSGPYAGGGTMYPGGGGVNRVVISGSSLATTFPIFYNSPDINGDCRVDLVDIQRFATVLFYSYDYSCDFNYDGFLNLSDIGIMAQALGNSVKDASKNSESGDQACSPQFSELRNVGRLGLYADSQGFQNNLSINPNEPFELFLLMTDAQDVSGIQAWECQVEIPDNIRVLEWIMPDQALNVFEAPEFMVGLAEPVITDGPVLLAKARCVAIDDQPALFYMQPFWTPSAGSNTSTIVVGTAEENFYLAALEIADGSSGTPVFGVNTTGEMDLPQALPTKFVLRANVPNPFNPMTVIRFDVPQAGHVELSVYSVDGRRVTTLVSDHVTAGTHEAVWHGEDDSGQRVASGVYFCRMSAAGFEQTQRMMLVK